MLKRLFILFVTGFSMISNAVSAQSTEVQFASFQTKSGDRLEIELDPNGLSGIDTRTQGKWSSLGIVLFERNGLTCLGFPYQNCLIAYQQDCGLLIVFGDFHNLAAHCVKPKERLDAPSQTLVVDGRAELGVQERSIYSSRFNGEGNLIEFYEASADMKLEDRFELSSGQLNFQEFLTLATVLDLSDSD